MKPQPLNRYKLSPIVSLTTLAATLLLAAMPALGDHSRIGWRGDGSGSYPNANPPTKWSATENVLWKTEMPGRSNAAPIVVGDCVFTCTEPSTLLCVSAVDGKIRWSDPVTFADTTPDDNPEAADIIRRLKTVRTAAEQKAIEKEMLRNDYFEMPPIMEEHFGFFMEYTMPTPTSDGAYVYVVYGTGLVASYDLSGNRRWLRMLAKPSSATGLAASPLLAGGRLIVLMGGELFGLDLDTGKTVWSAKQKERYGSPVRAKLGEVDLAVLPGGDVFRAVDGKKLAEKVSVNAYQSAIVQDDVVYSMRDDAFSEEDGSALMMAVRLKPAPHDGITTEKLWETKNPSGFSSPVYADGLIYNSRNKFGLTAIDAATGEFVYNQSFAGLGDKQSFDSQNFPCLARAGQYLFVPFQTGKVTVVRLGREYQEVAVNSLCDSGDQMVGAPLFVDSRLFIRTHKYLFCIAAQ